MFKKIAQAGCQHHQQHHHESRCGKYGPFAHDHFGQGFCCSGIAREFEQAQQAKYSQKAQVEQVVQEGLQVEGEDGQEVDHRGCLPGLLQASTQSVLETWFFNTAVQAHAIFEGKNPYRNRIEDDELNVQQIVNALD